MRKRGPTIRTDFICRGCGASNYTRLAKHRAEAHHKATGHGYLFRLVVIHNVPACKPKTRDGRRE